MEAEPVALCSWCARGRLGEEWLDLDALLRAARLLERDDLPPISYGICAPCRHEMAADVLVPARAGQSPA